MRTITAYLRYDWRRRATRHLVLLALVLAWIWIPGLAGPVGSSPSPKFFAMASLFMGCQFAGLFLFASTVLELGREGSPRERRSFIHTLPLQPGWWATGKLLGAILWCGIVPILGFALSMGAARVFSGAPLVAIPFAVGAVALQVLPLCLLLLVWLLLCAAMMPRGWALLAFPLVLLAEAMARNATNMQEAFSRLWSASPPNGADTVLLYVLVALLGAVFVFYHMNRRSGWAALAAMVVLLGVGEARALLWR